MNLNQEWLSYQLDEICEIQYGTRVTRKNDAGTIFPVYGGGGATFKMDIFNREDCVIISRFAMSEKTVRRVSGKFFLNDSGLSIKSKDLSKLSNEYLESYMFSLNDEIYSLGRGTAQKNLNMKAFKKLLINFPKSLDEQKRIVSKMKEVTIAIECAIQNMNKSIKNFEELEKSLFEKNFRQGRV